MTTPGDRTPERMRACIKEGYPACLNDAVIHMFGEYGRNRLNHIVMNGIFADSSVESTKDVGSLYEKFVERAGDILGKDVADVIVFESLKQMEEKLCTKCPLFAKHSKTIA